MQKRIWKQKIKEHTHHETRTHALRNMHCGHHGDEVKEDTYKNCTPRPRPPLPQQHYYALTSHVAPLVEEREEESNQNIPLATSITVLSGLDFCAKCDFCVKGWVRGICMRRILWFRCFLMI